MAGHEDTTISRSCARNKMILRLYITLKTYCVQSTRPQRFRSSVISPCSIGSINPRTMVGVTPPRVDLYRYVACACRAHTDIEIVVNPVQCLEDCSRRTFALGVSRKLQKKKMPEVKCFQGPARGACFRPVGPAQRLPSLISLAAYVLATS